MDGPWSLKDGVSTGPTRGQRMQTLYAPDSCTSGVRIPSFKDRLPRLTVAGNYLGNASLE